MEKSTARLQLCLDLNLSVKSVRKRSSFFCEVSCPHAHPNADEKERRRRLHSVGKRSIECAVVAKQYFGKKNCVPFLKGPQTLDGPYCKMYHRWNVAYFRNHPRKWKRMLIVGEKHDAGFRG